MFRYMSAAAVVNVLSFEIGILWGAVGVAAVSGVSYLCIQTPLVMYGATRHGPVSFVMIVRCILPICSAAVVAISVIWLRGRAPDRRYPRGSRADAGPGGGHR